MKTLDKLPVATASLADRDFFAQRILGLGMLALSILSVADPALSATSASEDSVISITVEDATQISKLDDNFVGIFTATDTLVGISYSWEWLCVYSSTGSYDLQIISQNGGGSLNLRSSSGDTMDYTMYTYLAQGGTSGFDYIGTETTITRTALPASLDINCDDGQNLSGHNLFFAPVVGSASFNAAPAGIYTDLLTLIVSPQ